MVQELFCITHAEELTVKLKTYCMRKILIFFAGTLISGSLLAGGLVTNTNQSALYTRLQSRNASTAIDAVYYNPAGLGKLGSGFYASINNQTVGQTKSILNNYMYLAGTPKEYIGKVSAPLFPGVYAAFKAGKFAVSAGFNPVGGGGGAKYDKGLPSFETQIADLVPLLVSKGFPTTQYSADIYFEGTSIYFGYQANLTYEINKMISVAAGIRMVTAKNTYNGYMRNISVNPNYPAFGAAFNGSMVKAADFFTAGATTLNGLSSTATSLASTINTAIGGGTPANTPLSAMPAALVAGVTQVLGAAGINATGMNIGTASANLTGVAPVFTANATQMTGYAASTQNVEVDAEQTGSGFSPILSVNISPIDKLNIAIKYEFQTKLELTTKLIDNKGGGVFTEGEKTIADMPALLAAGVEFRPLDKLMVTGSMEYYFDKNVDYDGSESLNINMIDKNEVAFSLGGEYGVNDHLRVSAGWMGSFTGVNSNYQSDQTYSLNTNSFGAGFGYSITPLIDLNIGGQYTLYKEGTKSFTHTLGTTPIPVTETYNKDTWVVAIGVDLYFGKK
jgi:long-subunit fatty acid transport protein